MQEIPMNQARSRRGDGFGSTPLARLTIGMLGIVAGGVLLGSLLALYARPEPRPRPAAAWAAMFQREEIPLDTARIWIEAPPTDLQPGWQSSYRPDLDYDTVVTGWVPPPLPEWDVSDATAEQVTTAEPVPAPIDVAADAAEQAAADAQVAGPAALPAGGTEEPRGLW